MRMKWWTRGLWCLLIFLILSLYSANLNKSVYDELDDSSIINAWVSWGKTFTGLAIAGKLGQKTLVITHTVPLRNQWAKEVEKVYGFSPGIIGSGSFEH